MVNISVNIYSLPFPFPLPFVALVGLAVLAMTGGLTGATTTGAIVIGGIVIGGIVTRIGAWVLLTGTPAVLLVFPFVTLVVPLPFVLPPQTQVSWAADDV